MGYQKTSEARQLWGLLLAFISLPQWFVEDFVQRGFCAHVLDVVSILTQLCPAAVMLCFPLQAGVQPKAGVSACGLPQQRWEAIWARCVQKRVVSSHWWALSARSMRGSSSTLLVTSAST